MTMISSVVEHNQVIQGNHANQGSDNWKEMSSLLDYKTNTNECHRDIYLKKIRVNYT